ncbi:GlxA family transcriptional regulator [Stackebrandtia nassauensis]|uniref:Transcriptional regulator, AraC family n=1 Tax=Stackebrandtia nassauensis (strain DSM 44728 / CIP 108903 / NRRL B-16338 / NBRC 102104 / LLR-40K-21) TaxID=446470 RepID=D3Q4X4_STANL|nr:helix-turn-helix domain-containing protein [Stackebrandtia nassauensis]ADD42154.1 transcriptional regulator, AraC family [Stackebrandtia nassauensis DSM 44728]
MIERHKVAVLALDDVYPFDLGIPARVFRAMTPDDEPSPYEVVTCSVDGAPVRTNADYSLTVDHDASILAEADTVIVPPHGDPYPFGIDGTLPEPVAAALARIRPGTRIVSLCTAAYVLAAAGLLDHRPATTHWVAAEHFQGLYPDVDLDPGVLFVDDGDVLTSAGAGAAIDLCLHIVRRDHGSAAASNAARRCVVPPWRDGGQAQFIERPVPVATDSSTTATRAWALERLGQPLTLDDLAGHARMSRRTFTRRFRAEVGASPSQWLIQQRVDAARELLETSDLTTDRVARDCGFGTATSLRLHFHAELGVSPAAYRSTFRARSAAVA